MEQAGTSQIRAGGGAAYIIYNCDIPKHKNIKLAIFVDNTATYSNYWKKGQDTKNVIDHAEELQTYFRNSKTKINAAKTKYIVFSQKIKEKSPDNITVFNAKIDRSNCIKYLGVKLDAKLNVNQHVQYTINKVNNGIGSHYPLIGQKSKMNQENKLKIYKTIIKPALL